MMFHALTKDIEESFFAGNMSTFIALAPVLTETPFSYEYEEFIAQDWKLKEDFPSLMGISFRAKNELYESFCEVASKKLCAMLILMRKKNMMSKEGIVAGVDTRSLFHTIQNQIENRFQAYAPNYHEADGRQTELSDLREIDKVPVYLFRAENDGIIENAQFWKETAKKIPSLMKLTTIPQQHGNFFKNPYGSSGELFMQDLLKILDKTTRVPVASPSQNEDEDCEVP